MSLINLPAFLTRRREDSPMEQTSSPAETVKMRFATQGGAEVHVTDSNVVTCLGCDHTKTSSHVVYARTEANDHAADCRSMPKPEA